MPTGIVGSFKYILKLIEMEDNYLKSKELNLDVSKKKQKRVLKVIFYPFKLLIAIFRTGWRPMLFGIVLALLCRAYVLDIYGVSKPSMEPTLHSQEKGICDKVAVFKLAKLLCSFSRWDLCVFRKKNKGHNIVKRIVGLPGEWIKIKEGDVFIGKQPRKLKILRKTPEELKRVLIPLTDLTIRRIAYPTDTIWNYNPKSWFFNGSECIALSNNAILEWRGLVHGGYITPEGEINLSSIAVKDFGLDVIWMPKTRDSNLTIKLLALGREFKAKVLTRKGLIFIFYNNENLFTVRSIRLAKGYPVHLTFIQADCRIFLWVGTKSFYRDIPDWPPKENRITLKGKWNDIVVSIENMGKIKDLKVLRDIYYGYIPGNEHGTGEKPELVGMDEFYVLGDNSSFSEDSRYYGPIKKSWIVGKAFLIVLPFKRFRWL